MACCKTMRLTLMNIVYLFQEKAGYCCDDKQVVVMKSALSKADKLLNG